MALFEPISQRLGKPMANALSKIFSIFRLSPFGYLNATQFLGAMNDNIFKLLIAYCFIQAEGTKASTSILAAVGALYVIPFLLFSQTAGMMADRFSKRTIIVATKAIEIVVMLLGMAAFAFLSKLLAFTGLFLLATHSAIFGPCKYGIVPEIVPQENISKANGLVTSCTYIAIIIGTFLASFLTEMTDRHFTFAAAICLVFSLLGFMTSLKIPKTAPAGSRKKVTPWFITELIRSLRVIRQVPSLLTAVIGSAYFLFVGSFIQLNMIPFAIHSLALSDIQGGYLFLLTALGIGAGSLMAGKLSGKAVELGLVPIGGIGMTICCFLLDYFSSHLYAVVGLVVLVGLFGGIYLVPLDSFIQIASPKTYRGQVVATTNFLGFFGVLCSAGVLYLLSVILELPADRGFTIMGSVTIFMVTLITLTMSGYVVRFASFLVSRILFCVFLKGKEDIPLNKPSFFFIPHSFWPWAMVLLASQRRRMRLFSLDSESNVNPTFLVRFAKWFFAINDVHSAEALTPTGLEGELIAHSLQRGTSIAVFCSEKQFIQASQEWMREWKSETKESSFLFFSLTAIFEQNFPKKWKRPILKAEVTRIDLVLPQDNSFVLTSDFFPSFARKAH